VISLEASPGGLTVVSRLARVPALGVLVAVLLGGAALADARAPWLAAGLGLGAALLLFLGARAVHARLAGGRVTVAPASPLGARVARPLSDFSTVAVETLGEARSRRAEALARGYSARSGGDPIPGWLRRPATAGVNDQLHRLVLIARTGEPLPITAWLAPEDDLELARREVEARLGW
jgi:hypothetical protein